MKNSLNSEVTIKSFFHTITIIAQIILGILFILSTASDIQLGFGIVLLTMGIINATKK